jgi:tetratricopeptide (TPR) repeat protein
MQKRLILTGIGLVALVFAIYANSLGHAFTNWDDDHLVLNNPGVHSIRLDIWRPVAGQTYQPLRVFSYSLNYAAHGEAPFGYHLVNTLLHAAGVVLLWLFLRRALPALGVERHEQVALFVALLFAVHPVNVESVTWITSRKYGLLAVFGFLSLWLYVREQGVPAVIAALCATLSSPFGITIPVLIVLYDFCRGCELRKSWKRQAPFAVCALAVLPLAVGIVGGAGGRTDVVKSGLNPLWAFFSMLRCLFDYARNLVLPLWLNNRYPDHVSTNPFSLKILLAVAGIVAIGLLVWRRYKAGDRLLLFCAGWALITWLPVSGLVPISTMMADRYLYLPGVGIFLALVLRLRSPQVLSVIVAIFAIGSIARNGVWRDSRSLWTDSVAKNPRNYAAQVSLALALEDAGENQQAAEHYEAALELNPDFFLAQLNYGLLRLNLGQLSLAENHLRRAVELEPGHTGTRLNLGLAQMAAERSDDAIATFRELLAIDADNADAHNALGTLLRKRDPGGALPHFQQALKLRPADPRLRCNLATALRDLGDLDGALAALAPVPDSFVDVHRHRAEICELRKDSAAAIAHWRRFQVSHGVDHQATVRLGALLRKSGDLPEAIQAYEGAIRLNSHDRGSRVALVALYLETGARDKARLFAIEHCARNPRLARDLRAALRADRAFAESLRTAEGLLSGEAAWALGDHQAAKGQFANSATGAFPGYLALGELLLELGDAAGARSALETASRLAPDVPEVQAALDRLAE